MTTKSLAGGDSGAETSAQLRGKVESESIPQALRRRIEGAVEALGGRVTVGDVAARAGASLEDTERTLNALAADSQGVLQVGMSFQPQMSAHHCKNHCVPVVQLLLCRHVQQDEECKSDTICGCRPGVRFWGCLVRFATKLQVHHPGPLMAAEAGARPCQSQGSSRLCCASEFWHCACGIHRPGVAYHHCHFDSQQQQ